MTEASTPTENRRKVAELIKGVRIAMLTTMDQTGRLVSRPMTTQDVEFDGDIWFIARRDSDLAAQLGEGQLGEGQLGAGGVEANVAYAGSSSWVSVSGKARVVDDRAKLEEQWNRMTDAFLEGGPDNPDNVLILVEGESAEYWESPGGPVSRLANLAKSLVKKEPMDGENAVVDL